MDDIGALTSDVAVSLASEVGVTLQVPGNHDDVVDEDLNTVQGLVEAVDPNDPSNVNSGTLHVVPGQAVSIPGTNEQEVIGMLLQSQQVQEAADETEHQIELPDGTLLNPDTSDLMQAVTLADGTTAYIQHKKGGRKFMEGQAVTLADGSTAIVQITNAVKEEPVQVPVQAEIPGTKFEDGQAVQLEDGTTAFIHNTPKEGLQAIQLEDGTTAYLSHSVAEGIFGEAATLDSTSIPLEQLTAQMPTKEPESAAAVMATQPSFEESPRLAIITSAPPTFTTDKSLVMTDKAFKCNFEGCGRLYTTFHHLKVHERSHTGDRPFKCAHANCGKAFATGYGLKSHTRVHTGEKPYKCSDEACNKAFKTSGDLQKHVRTHTGERPFKCPFEGCERSFTTSNIRKVHIRTHTGERPYLCTEKGCGRAFASATNYKNHIRIHTGEKPYVCTVHNCGKRFTEYSSLYKHHVVHTHSKPYECNHCGKNYRQTSTLAMHKRTAHNEDISPEAEAELFAQHGELGDISELQAKRAKIEFTLTNPEALSDGTPGQSGDHETPMVINTSQHITMVTTNGTTPGTDDQTMSPALQATQQATHVTLHQLQQQGLTGVSVGDGGQIYVVTDPAQLEALQQLAVQQLELHPTGAIDGSEAVSVISDTPPPGAIIVASADNPTLLQDTDTVE